MSSTAAFNLLCTDLGFVGESTPSAVADAMHNDLDAAAAELADAGIVIDQSVPRDLRLLVIYAAWIYRGRDAQPPMLRRLLRNRQAALNVGGST